MATNEEMENLYKILRTKKDEGKPVERDVAIHAALLISNGWPAKDALEESERTLNDAEREGQY